jgi:WD40 repeat protein
VSTDSNTDVLWTLVSSAGDTRLRVYTVDKRRAVGDNVTWRDVTVPGHVTVNLRGSNLANDSHTSIFATDQNNNAVHVWSVSGQYDRQLVSPQQLVSQIWRVAVDTQRHVMYVGFDEGRVSVFELK